MVERVTSLIRAAGKDFVLILLSEITPQKLAAFQVGLVPHPLGMSVPSSTGTLLLVGVASPSADAYNKVHVQAPPPSRPTTSLQHQYSPHVSGTQVEQSHFGVWGVGPPAAVRFAVCSVMSLPYHTHRYPTHLKGLTG